MTKVFWGNKIIGHYCYYCHNRHYFNIGRKVGWFFLPFDTLKATFSQRYANRQTDQQTNNYTSRAALCSQKRQLNCHNGLNYTSSRPKECKIKTLPSASTPIKCFALSHPYLKVIQFMGPSYPAHQDTLQDSTQPTPLYKRKLTWICC